MKAERYKAIRLHKNSGPLLLLTALAEGGGHIPRDDFQTMLINLYSNQWARYECRRKLTVAGLIENRMVLTPAGAALLASKSTPKKKDPKCAKRAPTAGRKATAPTAVPCDSTPLAMAWMGHR